MLDCSDRLRQPGEGVKNLGKLSSDTLEGWLAPGSAGRSADLPGAKARELIALAVAVTVRCDGCIATHVDAGLEHGATREEIAWALGVVIVVNAGAALVYSPRTLDAYPAAGDAKSN